jgi:hypothetical protein
MSCNYIYKTETDLSTLEWYPQIGYLQTWLLYHNALSSGVVIEDILKHARKTKEMASDEVQYATS